MLSRVIALAALGALALALPVDRYSAAYGTAPGGDVGPLPQGHPSPPEGPYVGNGDISAIYSGNASSAAPPAPRGKVVQGWQQWLYLSKNDLWSSDAHNYYIHLSAGRVGILLQPPGAGPTANASVAMFPGNASITHSLSTSGGAAVVGATRVLENNAIVTTLTCTSQSGGPCALTLLLSDTDANHYGVAQDAGAAPDGSLVWWRKENLHNALNPVYLGPCSPNVPLQSTERLFTVEPATGALALANGSCLWSDEAAAPGVVTVGDCSAPHGAWVWRGSAASADIVHSASSTCLVEGAGGALALGACGAAPWARLDGNASFLYLNATGSSAGASCLVAVPDNNNNTLGVALGVADAGGALVQGTAARVSAQDASAGITLSLSLASGAEYTLLVGLQTLRDVGCAGIRPQWEACATPPQAAAAALVVAMAGTAQRSAAVQASAAFWEGFWAASSVDLTAGATPNASSALGTVERWYYLSQYLLGCTTRDGKVLPALDGFVAVEPVPWEDQFSESQKGGQGGPAAAHCPAPRAHTPSHPPPLPLHSLRLFFFSPQRWTTIWRRSTGARGPPTAWTFCTPLWPGPPTLALWPRRACARRPQARGATMSAGPAPWAGALQGRPASLMAAPT